MHSHPKLPPRDAAPVRRLMPVFPKAPSAAFRATLSATLFATVLAACGGGALQVGVSTPQVSLTPPSPSDALNLCGNVTTVGDVLARLNARRSQPLDCRTRGLFASTTPLAWNAMLAQAAGAHSLDMATNNYFSHSSPVGSTVATRVGAAGYTWSSVGENIAGGPAGVDAVIDGWVASDGHCANIMAPGFSEFGLACAFNAASTFRTYWTLVLAAPR